MNMIGKTLQVWWPSIIILKKTPVWWPFLLSHRRHESSDDHLLLSQRKPHRMTISWRQVRRKNWWLARAAFPPSRCRSYVWIVTDKTGKNDLIEKKYHLFPLHDHDKAFTEYLPDVQRRATSLLCNQKSFSVLFCLPATGNLFLVHNVETKKESFLETVPHGKEGEANKETERSTKVGNER